MGAKLHDGVQTWLYLEGNGLVSRVGVRCLIGLPNVETLGKEEYAFSCDGAQ